MKKIIFMLVGGLILQSPISGAITRVGNGVIQSEALGFTAEEGVGSSFQKIGAEAARFSNSRLGPGIYTSPSAPFPIFNPIEYFELESFAVLYPELKNATQADVNAFFTDHQWQKLESKNSCITTYVVAGQTAYTLVAVWGINKGYVLMGEKSSSIYGRMIKLYNSTQLMDGACSWK